MSMDFLPAAQVHAQLLAAMHRICFAEPWNEAAMASLLSLPGTIGLIAAEDGDTAPGGTGPAGMVLWRVAADEAEILSICILPSWRRQGLGNRLLRAAIKEAMAAKAITMFLEVAASNSSGRALYQGLGFTEVGRRPRYYDNGDDALTMRLDL